MLSKVDSVGLNKSFVYVLSAKKKKEKKATIYCPTETKHLQVLKVKIYNDN